MSILRFSQPTGTDRTIAPGVTNYFAPMGGTPTLTAEASAQIVAADTATVSSLGVYVVANSLTTATTTFGFRVNGVSSALTVSVPAGATGSFSDVTNTAAVADGDLICFIISTSAGGSGTCTFADVIAWYDVAGQQVQLFNSAQTTATYVNNSTAYVIPVACITLTPLSTNESQLIATSDVAGTWRDMGVYIESNTRVTTTTLRSRKNSANGNQTISVAGGATGQFRDTTNTDSIAVGDTMTYTFTTGASGGGVILTRNIFSWFASSNQQYNCFSDAAGTVFNNFATAWGPIPGSTTFSNTPDRYFTPWRKLVRLSKLQARVPSNTSNGTITMASWIGGALGNQTLSIPAGATGFFQDTTNTDTVTVGSTAGARLSTTGTSGTTDIKVFGWMVEGIGGFVQACIF
jgi:hypothetical protein